MRKALATALVLAPLAACAPPSGEPPPPAREPAEAGIVLTDVTEAAGLRFHHRNGASERRYLPETMGSGVAFFDYDGDGDGDLYLVDSLPIAAGDARAEGTGGGALYRNLGGGRFEDASREAGLGGDGGFSSSAAFLDADRDGQLDLFVGRYVEWSPEGDVRCSPDGEHATYCTPEVYRGAVNRLYRNLGDGRFEDVTERSGLGAEGKTLGVVPIDHEGDGWPDLAVANDTSPNALYLNRGDGTFRDAAIELGVAFSLSGATRGGMGIDAGDLDGDGREALVVGNFSQEMSAVYRASSHGFYSDDAARLGVGLPTLMHLAFGTLVVDLDGDGWLDAVFANGHIEPDVSRFQALQSYAQPLLVFRNLGHAEGFEAVEPVPGSALATPWVGRGLASGDADLDGDPDLVLTQNGRAARLLRNDSPPHRWLRLRLLGASGSASPYGAVVTAVAGERRIVRRLVSGRSYLSASEPVLSLGLGGLESLDRLEVRWPSGRVQSLLDPPLDRTLSLREP